MELEMTAALALEAQRWIEAIETDAKRALNDLSAKAAGFDNFSHMARREVGMKVFPLEARGEFEVVYKRPVDEDPRVVIRFMCVYDDISGTEFDATFHIRMCGQTFVVDV